MRSNGEASHFSEGAFALVVGITEFKAEEYSEHPLPQAENDALDLAARLHQRLGWKQDHVRLLKGPVSKAEILGELKYLEAAILRAPDPTLFLMFLSTHGHMYKDPLNGFRTVLLAHDTRLSSGLNLNETGMTGQWLGTMIAVLRAKQCVFIADACFSGAAVRATDVSPRDIYKGIEAAVISSSVLKSYAPPERRNSIFTEVLLEILDQAKGEITILDICGRLSSLVPERSQDLVKELQQSFFSLQGGNIVLGMAGAAPPRRITTAELRGFCTRQLEWTIGVQTGPFDPGRYVERRAPEDLYRRFLEHDRARIFTVIGAAGQGKSTLLSYLALQTSRGDYPVLWIAPALVHLQRDAEDILLAAFDGSGWQLSLDELQRLIPENRSLVVYLDAINEWNISEQRTTAICAELLDLTSRLNMRLVVSCRELSWSELGRPFANSQLVFGARESGATAVDTGVVSAALAGFEDAELMVATAFYTGARSEEFGDLIRHPLFLRLLSDVLAQREAARPTRFTEILALYIEAKIEHIARRVGKPPFAIERGLLDIIQAMFDQRSESLPVEDCFRVAGEAPVISMLSEGILIRTGPEVAVEAELIHEYLLSRLLPADPFTDLQKLRSDARECRLLVGAAIMRMVQMANASRVLEILQQLQSESEWLLMALARMSGIAPFRDFYLTWFRERAGGLYRYGPDVFAAVSLWLNRDYAFCLEVARIFFRLENYYPWETKRWRNKGYAELERHVAYPYEYTPRFLWNCLERSPAAGARLLISEWLGDSSGLSSGFTRISDVAETYLTMCGLKHPGLVCREIDAAVQSKVRLPEQLGIIMRRLVRASPDVAIRYIDNWFVEPRLVKLAISSITGLEGAQWAVVLPIVKKWVSRWGTQPRSSGELLSVLGHYPSEAVMQYVETISKERPLRVGVLYALCGLQPGFTARVVEVARHIAWDGDLTEEEGREALHFYLGLAQARPETAASFIHHWLTTYPGLLNRELSWWMLVSLVPQSQAALLAVVEMWLASERDKGVVERLLEFIADTRPLQTSDLPAIKLCLDSPENPRILLDSVFQSDLPETTKIDLLFSIFPQCELFNLNFDHTYSGLIQRIINDPRFGKLPRSHQEFLVRWTPGEDPDSVSTTA